jgi:PAS domain S-box-containing protein
LVKTVDGAEPGSILFIAPAEGPSLSQTAELRAAGWRVRLGQWVPEPGAGMAAAEVPDLVLLRLAPEEEDAWLQAVLQAPGLERVPLLLLAEGLSDTADQRLGERAGVSFVHPQAAGAVLRRAVRAALEAGEDRRQAEAASDRLQQATASLQDLYDNAPVGYHSLDAQGCVIKINRTELDWLGYTAEEALGHPVRDFLTPEGWQIFQANFPQFKQRGWIKDMQLDFQHKDGASLPALVNATAFLDEQGNYRMSRSTVIDNRAHKQAEQAVSASEAEKRAILNSLAAQIALLDERGMVTAVNQSWLDFSGQNGGGLNAIQPGESYLAVCDRAAVDSQDALAAEAARGIRSVMQGRLPDFQLEYPCDSPTEKRWFLMQVVPSVGSPGGVVVSHSEITGQKQAEQALRESEATLNSFFNSTQALMGILRLLPEEDDLELVRANQAELELLGCPPEAVPGLRLSQTGMSPSNLRLWIEQCNLCQEARLPVRFEYTRRKPDGSHWMLVTLNGVTPGIFSFAASEISHLKRMQFDLQQLNGVLEQRVALRTEELSQANRELGQALRLREELLQNLSHELRTPLNGILGMAEALQAQVYGALTPRQAQGVELIVSSGERLLKLVNRLLEMSQLLAGRVKLQPALVPVDFILKDCLRQVQTEARRKRQQVGLTQDSRVDYLEVDPQRLGQALVELLRNGVKFTPEGGRVGLEFEADGEAGVVRWVVWDTGIGMPPEQLAQLFELFMQGDGGLARQHEGLGLGLALVYELVKLLGGSVAVQSAPGKGSRFTISLPWTQSLTLAE